MDTFISKHESGGTELSSSVLHENEYAVAVHLMNDDEIEKEDLKETSTWTHF